jgi:hypothetical protein
MAGGRLMLVSKGNGKSKSYAKKKKSVPRTISAVAKSGLNRKEQYQVKKMIKGQRETFYLNTVSYMIGQGVAGTYKKAQLAPQSCFQSGNRITMLGLLSADTFTAIGNDVNSNSVHTSGTRLYLTHGCRVRDLNGIADAELDGDMGYMKSHLQKIKIHAKALVKANDSTITDYQIPLNFRVLVVQVNGKKPAGSVPSFTNVGSTGSPSLFRNHLNEKKGIDDQITTPYEFQQGLRVDTEAFKVIKDFKFKLSNPLMLKTTDTTDNIYQDANFMQYPATKELDIWLPQPKKPVKFEEGTQLPTNYDYRYYTLVFCTADSTYGSSNNVPTTEDRWILESTSIARCQEY